MPYPIINNGETGLVSRGKINSVLSVIRETLTANRTYFVNASTGNDSNDGLTSGTAFLTVQHAYDVANDLDFNNFTVTINVADGTYAPGSGVSALNFNVGWVGGGTLALVGNTTTPANCVLSCTNASCIVINAVLIGALTIGGFKLTTATGGHCLEISQPAYVSLSGKMEFGACASFHISVSVNGAFFITLGQPYTISGGATFHLLCGGQGHINSNSSTVTLTGTPAFSIFAWASRLGFIEAAVVTYSGAATGTRYVADTNAVIYTNGGGANYFPGDSAGSTGTGGQYT